MDIKSFKVGQTVYILGDGRREMSKSLATAAEVAKVGTKYVTINDRYETKFKGTSEIRPYLVEHKDYGVPRFLFPSSESVDEYCEREELKRLVMKAAGWDMIDRYSLDQLRAVKRILEGDGDSEA